jgi:hypothetical protein
MAVVLPPSDPASPNAGGKLNPIYMERDMRCLVVSESELKHIGLANLGVTAFVGIGSALLSFGIDLFKDTALESPDQASAAAVADAVERLCVGAGIVCYIVALLIWIWRWDMIRTIRSESRARESGVS